MDASAPSNSPQNEAVNPSRRPLRKRRRLLISCTECHRRKIKCDRNLPCSNCQARNRASCRYETLDKPNPPGREPGTDVPGSSINETIEPTQSATQSPGDPPPRAPGTESRMAKAKEEGPEDAAARSGLAGLGYVHNGCTVGFLRTIESRSTGSNLTTDANPGTDQPASVSLRERYKSLIRQLPARDHVERLVDIYFREFGWHLDIGIFKEYLSQWYSIPFNLLSDAGPMGLSPDLRVFPALLFQALANALIMLPRDREVEFETLKYAGDMTFEDLGVDYSESGNSILMLLGKRQMTEITVLAGFVRCGFLKYTGLIMESWHQVASCIRDAQELGVYTDELDPKPDDETKEESKIRNIWKIQQRRRLWMSLVSWDLHTSVILGRPPVIDPSAPMPTLPIDAALPKDRYHTYPHPRGPNDPPTQLSRSVWVSKAIQPLRQIFNLNVEVDRGPEAHSLVDSLHQSILQLEKDVPGCFNFDNPDTRFDSNTGCRWVPGARMLIKQIMATNLMALHRSLVFTRAHSRREALKACLTILEVQRAQFVTLPPHQYKQFTLFFGPFDAAVLIAAVYLLFPLENLDLLEASLKHFRWTIGRFDAIASRNKPASSAVGVLRGIEARLHKAVGRQVYSSPGPIATGRLSVESLLQPADTPSGHVQQTQAQSVGFEAHASQLPSKDADGRSRRPYNSIRWRAVVPTVRVDHGSRHPHPPSTSVNGLSRRVSGWKNFGPDNPPQGSKDTLSTKGQTHGTGARDDSADSKQASILPGSSLAAVADSGTSADSTTDAASKTGGHSKNGAPTFLQTPDANTPLAPETEGLDAAATDWALPSNFDFSSIAPLYPTGDLLYHDLSGTPDGGVVGALDTGGGEGGARPAGNKQEQTSQQQHMSDAAVPSTPWIFEGEFGEDSLWNFLNQYS